MKKIFFFFTILLTISTFGQIPDISKGKPENFKELINKKLIVLLLEENPKTVKSLSKPKYANDLESYRMFIKQHNERFLDYVKKYWTFNSNNFEFKKASELDELMKNKKADKNFAVLGFQILGDTDSNFATELSNKSDFGVGALFFSAPESRNGYVKCYINGFNLKPINGEIIFEEDYKFALETLQNSIKSFINNDKVVNFRKYASNMIELNCSKLKSKQLLVNENALMKGRTEEGAKKNYDGDLKFVPQEELRKAYLTKEKGKAILLTYPYGVIKGSLSVISVARMIYLKVIVDCETGEILHSYMPGGFSYGANLTDSMTESEFKTIGKCDKP